MNENGEAPLVVQQTLDHTQEANSESPPPPPPPLPSLAKDVERLDVHTPKVRGRKRAFDKHENKEPVVPLLLERPTRERKAIQRFSSSVEKAKGKKFKIVKGSGTRLQDIPNVVFKLSRRKGSDEPVQYLHKLIFGKRVKPHQVKMNILQFSGFVWGGNEEKERARIKEKLEKSVKETLLQVSDMLDLGISKTGTKKEELVQKLFDFLESPHKISKQFVQEEEMSKEKKRKRTPSKGKVGTPQKRSTHEAYSSGKRNKEDERDEEDIDGIERSDYEESEEIEETEKTSRIHRKKSNVKQHQPKKRAKIQVDYQLEEQPEEIPERKSRLKRRKSNSTQKVAREPSSVYEPNEEDLGDEPGSKTVKAKSVKNSSNQKAIHSVKGSGKQNKKAGVKSSSKIKKEVDVVKRERKSGQNKARQEEKAVPSDEELRAAICELLKDADFSKATFRDVVKQLGVKLNVDLSEKKGHVKHLIQDEISKMVDEEEVGDDNSKAAAEDTRTEAKDKEAKEEEAKEDEVKNEEVKEEEAKVEEVKEEEAKNEEAKEEEAKDEEAAKEEEAKEEEVKDEEVKEEEAKVEEVKQEEAKNEEAKEEEAKEEEAKDEEAKEDEAKDEEAKEDEANDEEAKDEEAKNEEAKEDEAKDEEAKEDEAKDEEAKEDEAKDEEARHDEAKNEKAKDDDIKYDEAKEDDAKDEPLQKSEDDTKDELPQKSEDVATID